MVSVKKFSEHEGILYQQAFIECPLYENNNACIHNLQIISTNSIYDTVFIESIPFSDVKNCPCGTFLHHYVTDSAQFPFQEDIICLQRSQGGSKEGREEGIEGRRKEGNKERRERRREGEW